ncbi:hypothetical protein GCM10011289_15110 [Paludibacterium paludis]|uniref:Protein TonB n=2 Tax=Paludibacterium paludis TaxID=1225769 RepID=A0A918P1R0_9NEIS|nr:hypothetical protein GCM10011289_15110 [Paludibacterium paludis]
MVSLAPASAAPARSASPAPAPAPKPVRREIPTPQAKPVATPTSHAAAKPAPAPVPAVAEGGSHAGQAHGSPATAPGPAQGKAAESAVTPPLFSAGYLNNPRPSYPSLSRELGEEGKVLLKVMVGKDGKAMDIALSRSSGYPRLDRAATEAVRQWKFAPARRGDEIIAESVIVPVVFSLQSS